MNKKLLKKVLPVSALLLVVLLFSAFIKGGDGLTFFQRINVKNYISTSPFYDEETGDVIYTVNVAAANDSDATPENSFLWFRNRYDSYANYVELNVAFGKDGTAYLADSFDGVTESSVPFDRVLEFIAEKGDKETGFIIDLHEYSSLESFSANICRSDLYGRTVIRGVDENSLQTVKAYFPKIPVICTYDSDTKSSVEELATAGADGIICSTDEFSPSLFERAKEQDLQVWVEDDGDVYGIFKAIHCGVDGIVSPNPDMINYIVGSWGETLLDELKYNFDL